MNGPHDIGGRHGLGTIDPEPDEPVFHYPWEGRMYGIAFATIANGLLTIDEKRHAIERMPHAMYLDSSYYEHWLYAIEKLLDEKGLVNKEEVDTRVAEQVLEEMEAHPKAPENPSDLAARMQRILIEGTPHTVGTNLEPKFRAGDRVRARNLNPRTHLRLPGYAKKRVGVVEKHYGSFGHPGARAHEREEEPAHLYSVKFEAEELWGPDAEKAGDTVYLDLFEDYLESA